MSGFCIGDKISYPLHGAGVIEGIEEKNILDELRRYYVLRFSDGQMRVLIPVESAEGSGLRGVIDAQEVPAVKNVLVEDIEIDDIQNWNKRLRDNQERLKTGDIYEVAGVVKGLVRRMKEKGLSSGEKRMMNQALAILVSELACALDCEPGPLRERIISDIV